MANLLNETVAALRDAGKLPKDVLWVGTKDVHTTWDNFKKVADVQYDDGFGSPKVAQDLIVVGEYWWLERHEYDGSEWWEFKSTPIRPTTMVKLNAVIVGEDDSCGWVNLMELKANTQ